MPDPRYVVKAWPAWNVYDPTVASRHADLASAVKAARSCELPLLDLIEIGRGVIGQRRMVKHPGASQYELRDDFAEGGAFGAE